eukprot:scaffold8212_cov93-Cylindrotheca_fusiformis.AAC.10
MSCDLKRYWLNGCTRYIQYMYEILGSCCFVTWQCVFLKLSVFIGLRVKSRRLTILYAVLPKTMYLGEGEEEKQEDYYYTTRWNDLGKTPLFELSH